MPPTPDPDEQRRSPPERESTSSTGQRTTPRRRPSKPTETIVNGTGCGVYKRPLPLQPCRQANTDYQRARRARTRELITT